MKRRTHTYLIPSLLSQGVPACESPVSWFAMDLGGVCGYQYNVRISRNIPATGLPSSSPGSCVGGSGRALERDLPLGFRGLAGAFFALGFLEAATRFFVGDGDVAASSPVRDGDRGDLFF